MKLTWVEAQFPQAKRKRIPKWALQAAIDENGVVYIPALVAGSEMAVFLCASYDGISAVLSSDHAYYPARWIAQEFPKAKSAAENVERYVKECVAPTVP